MRPWQGAVEELPAAPPQYDPDCYLCPGNGRAGEARNPNYTGTFVFDNDFAALKPDVARERFDLDADGLLVAETEPGVCRVVCFSPRHDLTLSSMRPHDIEEVVRTWTAQYQELGAMPGIHHVQIFENRGALMGASNSHPHCQIWATSSLPEIPAKELGAQRNYRENRGSCLLCDVIKVEEQKKARVVFENECFVVLVPFWAVWPFELLVCCRRHLGSFPEFTNDEIALLSTTLCQISSTYDRVFNVPFPYSMGFHQTPTDGENHEEWHFHAHYFPPLLRSATVRKFMVGFELLCTPQRDITPESAAARLQELWKQGFAKS